MKDCVADQYEQSWILKVSKSRNEIVESELLPKIELRISALEVYYFKVDTKRESIFFLQEDRLSFVLDNLISRLTDL